MVQDCENIVRFLRDYEVKPQRGCLPRAFKLRRMVEKGKDVNETYISVDRACLPTFEKDAMCFDSGRNSLCAVINVGSLRNLSYSYLGHKITYEVKSEPSQALSHGGIYILHDGIAVVAGFLDTIDNNPARGQEKSSLTNAVRSHLANFASQHILHIHEVIDFSKEDQCLNKINATL